MHGMIDYQYEVGGLTRRRHLWPLLSQCLWSNITVINYFITSVLLWEDNSETLYGHKKNNDLLTAIFSSLHFYPREIKKKNRIKMENISHNVLVI